MKQIIVAVSAVLLFAGASLGQGTFTFANSPSTLVMITTVSGEVPADSSHQAKLEILWAPVGTTDWNLFQLVPGAVVNAGVISPGRFVGGTRTIPAGTGYGGIAPGATVSALIRGWTGPAATWNEFQFSWNGLIGYSGIFTIDTGDPTQMPAGTPASITSSTASPFTGITIGWIPEPSSAALFFLGGGLFCWRQRRRIGE